jgi:uncharacterized protein YbbK (DUF523 family)
MQVGSGFPVPRPAASLVGNSSPVKNTKQPVEKKKSSHSHSVLQYTV